MHFRWSDVSYVDQPGTYLLPDGKRVRIEARHIVLWTHDPDGVFETYLYPGNKKRLAEYTLTDFHQTHEGPQGWGKHAERGEWRPRA